MVSFTIIMDETNLSNLFSGNIGSYHVTYFSLHSFSSYIPPIQDRILPWECRTSCLGFVRIGITGMSRDHSQYSRQPPSYMYPS